MSFLIFFIALAIAIGAWIWLGRVLKKKEKGRIIRLIACLPTSLLIFFVSLAVMIPFLPEERAKSEAAAAARKIAQGIEAAKAAEYKAEEQRKAEEKAAYEKAHATEIATKLAEEKTKAALNKDRKIMAAIICQDFVKARLKAPSTADFPWLDYSAQQLANQTYEVRSYVDAQNSFGAKLRNQWQCKIRYLGNEEADSRNWSLIKMTIK